VLLESLHAEKLAANGIAVLPKGSGLRAPKDTLQESIQSTGLSRPQRAVQDRGCCVKAAEKWLRPEVEPLGGSPEWESINRLYWDVLYHLLPSGKTGIEAFAVIREAMRKTGMGRWAAWS
jgi:hypothetical protein